MHVVNDMSPFVYRTARSIYYIHTYMHIGRDKFYVTPVGHTVLIAFLKIYQRSKIIPTGEFTEYSKTYPCRVSCLNRSF